MRFVQVPLRWDAPEQEVQIRRLTVEVPPTVIDCQCSSGGVEIHRPGQDARLVFAVTDAAGKPTAAALSLAAVDEAVYSVQQAAPGVMATIAGNCASSGVPSRRVCSDSK